MSPVLKGQVTETKADLYMSLELGDKKWMLTLPDGRRGPSRYTVDAGDTAVVADCIRKAKERCGLAAEAKVHSCYEAGRDGRLEEFDDLFFLDTALVEPEQAVGTRQASDDRDMVP